MGLFLNVTKRTILIPAILMFCAMFTSCSAGKDEHYGRQQSLDGPWKIVETDDMKARDPQYDDSGCGNITIPGDWNSLLKKNVNYSTTVWLRKSFIPDSKLTGKPLYISLGTIGVADELYVNGIRIGSTGSIPDDPSHLHYHFAWQTPRVYFIPETCIKPGEMNVIAVRVFSHVISGVHGKTYIGQYTGYYGSGVIFSYFPIIANVSSVALNIMLLFIMLVILASQPRQIEYVFFSIILLLTILAALLILDYGVITSGMARYRIFLILYSLVNCCVLLSIERFFHADSRVVQIAAPVLLAPVIIIVSVARNTSVLISWGGAATIGYITLCILISAMLFVQAIRKDPRRYWYFAILAVVIPVSVLRNSYFLLTWQFNEFPLIIFFHVPVVFSVIILFMIYDLQKQRFEKDTLYTALSKKTRKYEKLLESLKKEDAKPEPRDIIYEVIEYLKANYSEKYNRQDLARRFNLNEDYMGQVFKKTTGMNISGYINKVRIDAALGLLAETEAKVIDIAYHIGFDNLTHFHRMFKNQTGMTPNEYRQKFSLKQVQGNDDSETDE